MKMLSVVLVDASHKLPMPGLPRFFGASEIVDVQAPFWRALLADGSIKLASADAAPAPAPVAPAPVVAPVAAPVAETPPTAAAVAPAAVPATPDVSALLATLEHQREAEASTIADLAAATAR